MTETIEESSTTRKTGFVSLRLDWAFGSEGKDPRRGDKALRRILTVVKEQGAGVCAVVDRRGMAGAFDYYKQASTMNIRPIFACETQVILRDSGDDTIFELHTLILLCRNREGWLSLLRLIAHGESQEPLDLPKLDVEDIRRHGAGLIGFSRCVTAASSIKESPFNPEKVRCAATVFKEVFEPGRFFMDLGDPRDESRETIRRESLSVARSKEIPVIVTTADVCSAADLEDHCAGFIEAVSNTSRIADLCEAVSPANYMALPTFDVPEGVSLFGYLKALAEGGLEDRLAQMRTANRNPDESHYRSCLAKELDHIEKQDLAGYFLLIYDCVHFARSRGIVVGPGRGNSASSLVLFALQICDVDPIRYGLHRELFINPLRVSLPSIIVEFCADRQDEVVGHLVERYGGDAVAEIVPSDDFERTHWNGKLCLSGDPLWERIPIYRRKDSERGAAPLVSRYNSDDAEYAGAITLYMIKSKIFSRIDRTLRRVNARLERKALLTFDNLPMDDPDAFALLSAGDTSDIFLLEDTDLQKILRLLQPRGLEDIAAAISLVRPAAINSGLLSEYLRARRDEKSDHIVSGLDELLHETNGVIIFNEQVMDVLHHFTGWSIGECDLCYRALRRKHPAETEMTKTRFLHAATETGFPVEDAVRYFDLLSDKAECTMVKHHCVAQAVISVRCAYLKAHYPEEWTAALRG